MKRTARILAWLATAAAALSLLATAWLWARSYAVADSWTLKGRDDVMQDTPGCWVWGLFSNAGFITFDHSFSMGRDPGLTHREFQPRTAFAPAAWRRFYFDRSPGYVVVTIPHWFILLLVAPLPAWRAWRWVSEPWRRKLRGFDVQAVSDKPTR